MKKLIIFILLLCGSSFFNLTYANPYILTGKEASNKVENAALLRYNDRSTLPNYVEFKSTHYLPEMRFNGWIQQFFKRGENVILSQQKVITDKLGFTHRRYQEIINGIPVEFGIITTHSKDGMIKSVSGELYPATVNLSAASLSLQNALQKALDHIGADQYMWEVPGNEAFVKEEQNKPNATFKPEGKLVYVYKNNVIGGQFRLAYKFNVYASKPMSRTMVWVDAETGEILYTDDLIKHTNATGTAQTMYSGSRTITTDKVNASQYRLRESNRAGGASIRTLNMNHGTSYGSATDFTNTNNTWSSGNWSTYSQNQAALDAHWGAEEVVDFYWAKFNRNSIDGSGMAVSGYVHYDNGYGNAFWDGSRMSYGDGDSQMNPVVALDVAGHEMTHGVVQYTANFTGSTGETAGLNESFADVFGNTIEHFAKPTQANWWIGEDVVISGGGIRNMANPKNNGRPNTYQGQYWNSGGTGEPHFWGCPHDYCYYLMVEGGSGTNDISNAYNISGIGWDEAINIAYRSLSNYLTSNTDYSDARFYAIQSAVDLYGSCSQEVITTTNSYYAIGVGNQYAGGAVVSDFTASPTSGCTVPFNVTFANTGSTGGGNTYSWNFGDGGTSTSENPTHTYANFGTYTVQLTTTPSQQGCGANSKTENNLIDVHSTNSCFSCDTINDPPSGTLTIYGTQQGGYLAGWNGYKDKSKANKFQNYGTYTNVSGAFIYFYGVYDSGSNAQVEINVWGDNAGQPGNVIGTMTISLLDLENNLTDTMGTHQGIIQFTYPNSIPVSSPYYMGIKMVGFTANDSLGIVSNNEGDSPNDMMWEMNVNSIWGTFAADWGSTTLDLYVAPIMTETPPQAVITTNQTTICVGDSIKYNGTTSLNTGSYVWSFANGNISSSTDSIVYVTYNTPGTYQTILGAIGGCSGMSTDTIDVTVTSGITVSATANNTAICAGGQVTLSATGATSYSWDNSLGSGASKTVSPTATTTYTVTGSASGGCSATDQVTVTVNTAPNVSATASNTTICAGTQVTLSATGATSYSWDNGLGSGASKTVSPTSTKTYEVTGTTNGCSATDQVLVTVNPSADANFVYFSNTICEGSGNATPTITTTGGSFSASNSGLVFVNISTGEIDMTSSSAGTYTVTYSITGTCGDSQTQTITITSSPDASFTYPNTTYCQDGGITSPVFSGGTSAGTFSSTSGLTINSSTGIINLSASSPGTYTVTNEITVSGACSDASDTYSITVNATPNVSLAADNITICTGEDVILTASGADSYSWNHGLSGGNPHTVSPTSDITYQVTGTTNGCSATDQVNIIVNQKPSLNVDQTIDPTTCNGLGSITLSFTNLPDGTYTVYYDGGSFTNVNVSGENATINVSNGIYNNLYIVNGTGCQSTDNPDVQITAPNAVNSTAGANSNAICSGGDIQLTANSISGATYDWTGPNGFTSSDQNPSISNANGTASGSYYLTITNASCTGTDTVAITVNPTPVVDAGSDFTACDTFNPIQLSGSPAGGTFFGPGTINNIFDPTTVGDGTITLVYTYTDNNGCTDSSAVNILVKDCTTGLSKNAMNSFSIYPNPASKYIKIEVNTNSEIQEIRMLTTIGQEIQVSTSKIDNHTFKLDVSPLATGTYFIQVTTNNNRITKKVVVH